MCEAKQNFVIGNRFAISAIATILLELLQVVYLFIVDFWYLKAVWNERNFSLLGWNQCCYLYDTGSLHTFLHTDIHIKQRYFLEFFCHTPSKVGQTYCFVSGSGRKHHSASLLTTDCKCIKTGNHIISGNKIKKKSLHVITMTRRWSTNGIEML